MTVKTVFGIYEKAMKPKGLKSLLETTAKAGYDYMELSLDESKERLARLDWDIEEINKVKKWAQDSGVRIFSACFSGHRKYPLGSADKAIEHRAKAMLERGIILCERLGIRVLQIAGYDVFYEPHGEDTQKRYLENLAKGVDFAAELGVTLAIEPVEVFLDSVDKIMEIIRMIDSPWLQVYPDISNLKSLGKDPVEQLEFARGHIAAIHIRDSLPDFFYNVELGTGTMDFVAVFKKLKEMKYQGPYLIEMWDQEGVDDLKAITDARKFMIGKMEEANV